VFPIDPLEKYDAIRIWRKHIYHSTSKIGKTGNHVAFEIKFGDILAAAQSMYEIQLLADASSQNWKRKDKARFKAKAHQWIRADIDSLKSGMLESEDENEEDEEEEEDEEGHWWIVPYRFMSMNRRILQVYVLSSFYCLLDFAEFNESNLYLCTKRWV